MNERLYMVRKGGYWYRPESQGYTAVPANAGLYNIDEALAQVDHGVSFVAQSEVLKDDLLPRLRMAQTMSCTCMTKPPDIEYHAPNCKYRLLEEAARTIEGYVARERGSVVDDDDENPLCDECGHKIGRDGCRC